MKDGTDHLAAVSLDTPLESPEPANAPGEAHDAVPGEKRGGILKDCGDCEPGGFGSTYGFSPR